MSKGASAIRLALVLAAFLFGAPAQVAGQCSNWAISAHLTTASTCAANGTFTVVRSGPDAANLSGIQYGIPIAANGFSVPLNSSATFTGVPAGTYQVSVVANCGSSIVGRNTTITIPGNYTPPALTADPAKASLSCAPTGIIFASVTNGVPPIIFNITSHPAAYTGPLTISGSARFCYFNNLPPGVYTVQAVDACLSGTVPKNATIASLNPATAPYIYLSPLARSCDTVVVFTPFIDSRTGGWYNYSADTTFKASVQISGNIASATPFARMPDSSFTFRLPAGKTIKHLYGQTITYTIKPPCGPGITLSQAISAPGLNATATQHCNTDFTANIWLTSIACFPITYTLHNNITATNYGPYTATASPYTTPALPIGSYTISFTTADGYTGVGFVSTVPVTANPYSVSVINGSAGLHNYAEGFRFTTSAGSTGGIKTIELFSGPAGYSFQGTWYDTLPYQVTVNGTPTPATLKFPAGSYVWKITDDCGVYYLPVSVTAGDLYQFLVGAPLQSPGCQGLWITPTGSAANNGVPVSVGFSILLNGAPLLVSSGASSVWPVYPLGTPILLTSPGTYTIVPTASYYVVYLGGYHSGFSLSYPNSYTSSYTFTYNQLPLAMDINHTQGFLCKGATTGQGQIYAAGMNGIPFYSPPSPHYKYALALPGNAVAGPYIANNNTGTFTGFGGNANAFYEVKVTDTCGAFNVQRIKILDLGTARLISSTKYVACAFGTVQLSAIYLPGATYSWTGPAGFTSTLRQPVIANVSALNIGVYRVTITTTQCSSTITDSTVLTMNQNPPKPFISYSCLPRPIAITVTNPVAGLLYKWDIGYLTAGNGGLHYSHGILQQSNVPFTKYPYAIGSYAAVAIDTMTGCTTNSDSLIIANDPFDSLQAGIYSPHLQLCTGDTTILVATGYSTIIAPAFQWYRNGAAIAGATGGSLITHLAGSYRVLIDAGLCSKDTSGSVTVNIIPPPAAVITAPRFAICVGDTAVLQASTGAGYSYTWYKNSTLIPGAFSSAYPATQAGSYTVTISNGGCVSSSAAVSVTVSTPPVVNLSPGTAQVICPGGTINFSTTANPLYSYTWSLNGSVINGATGNTYIALLPGIYQVTAASGQCPHAASPTVSVKALPAGVSLGPDTTVCAAGPFSIRLSADTGFAQIRWSTGQNTSAITAAMPGIYWVRATNSCGIFTDTVRIHTRAEYLPTLPDDTLICNASNAARLSVPLLLQDVHWSNGASTSFITVTTPGIYWVEGQSPCGLLRDTVNVNFCAPHIRNIRLARDSICEGDCITPTAEVDNYPKSYHWLFTGGHPAESDRPAPGSICYAAAGAYPVRLIVQSAGGRDTATGWLIVSAKPLPRFRDTTVVVPYKSIIGLPSCAAAQTVDWYAGDSLVCSNCRELTIDARYYRTVYRCVVRNGACPDSCSYILRVIDIPHDLWLPDAFTPNGDGRNDVFRIITDNPNIMVINLDVYNRWGQRVFTSNRNNGGWDGTLHGPGAESGTYFWQLRYKVLGAGEEVHYRRGDVLLVR